MRVREVTRSDLAAVAALEREIFGAEAYPAVFLRQALDLWPSLFWLAEEDSTPLGYALAAPAVQPGEAWILATAVQALGRGRGIGTALIERILGRLASAQVREVRLTVHPENASALRLYARSGFQVIGEEDEYFGPGAPRLLLRLNLRPRS